MSRTINDWKFFWGGQNIIDYHDNILGHVIMSQFDFIDTVKLLLSLRSADCDREISINISTAVVKIKSLITSVITYR